MERIFNKFGKVLLIMSLVFCLILGIASAEEAGTNPFYNPADLFSNRDLEQSADLSRTDKITVSDGSDVRITKAGVYVLTGSASGFTVYVEAGNDDKVQLVLDGLTVTNADFPCIYVVSADKVFITTSADSSLSVTGTFRADGDTETDGVIFSRDDLVLNGTAVLNISSSDNGIVCKDDLKITGGTYKIQVASKALDAKDSIRISDGVFEITAEKDAIHAEHKKEDTKGYVYIGGGTITIISKDDGIYATSVLQIDGGTLNVTAPQGLESTVIQINGGTIAISSEDNGINATENSSSYTPSVFFNSGEVTIDMGKDDRDAVDSNGDIYVNGGTITVIGDCSLDYNGKGVINGGTVIVNGVEVSSLPN